MQMKPALRMIVAFGISWYAAASNANDGPSNIEKLKSELKLALTIGEPRTAAEQALTNHQIKFRFLPRVKFTWNNITATIPPRSRDVAAALIGTSPVLHDSGVSEEFIIVVVYLDSAGHVLQVGLQGLAATP